MSRPGIGRLTIVVVVIIILVVAGVASYFYLTMSKPTVTAPSTINIGSVEPLTGSGASVGQDEKIAMDFWVNHVNQQGGLYMSAYGKKIPLNLIILDDGSDSSKDTTLAQTLVTNDGVVAFIGGGQVPEAVALVPIAERLHIPYVTFYNEYNTTYSFWTTIDPNPTYAFYVWPNFFSFTNLYFQWWNAQPASARPMSVAAITPNIPVFVTEAQNFLETAQANGMKVVMPVQVYDVTSTDLSPLVLKLKAASPDLVFGMSLPADGILFFKQSVQLNFTAKQFVFPPTVEYNQLAQSLGSNVNGLLTTTFWNWRETVNASAQLNTYYQSQMSGLDATPIAGCQTAAIQVLVDAISRAGVANGTAIAQALVSANVDTVQGVVKFDSGHNSYTLNPIMVQWQNATQQIVYPSSVATATLQYPQPPWSS